MIDTVKIAMMQMLVIADDAAQNLSHAEELLEQVKDKGYDIALFPECCDIGWGNPRAAELAREIPGETSGRFCDMARKYGKYICAGITEKDGDAVYNAAILVDPNGNILLKHRKINVCFDVTDVYTVGDRLGVVETPFGRVGVDICADNFVSNLAIGHTIARMGARLLLSPTSWAVSPEHDNARTPYGDDWTIPYEELSRLYDMGVVGVSNVGRVTMGSRDGWSSIGSSFAYGPGGKQLAALPFGEAAEEVYIAEVALRPSIARGDLTAAELVRRGYTGI